MTTATSALDSPARLISRHDGNERILAVSQSTFRGHLRFRGVRFDSGTLLTQILSGARLHFFPKDDVENLISFKQIITYVLIIAGEHVLTFRRPEGTSTPKLLRGRLCLGFGGHVNEHDFCRPGTISAKMLTSAMREFQEEVSLPRGFMKAVERKLRIAAILNDDTSALGKRHLGVVFVARLDTPKSLPKPSEREDDVLQISWKSRRQLERVPNALEKWSQWCVGSEIIWSRKV